MRYISDLHEGDQVSRFIYAKQNPREHPNLENHIIP